MKQTFVKAAIMASFMAAVSCGQAPTEQGPAQYGVTTIATTDREIQSNYSATIRGRQDIDIYPQVSGTISELRVTEGQSVSKGQTLFIIDQVPYKAALQTAEANVAAAKASVATAQLTYDSKKELFAKSVVSQYDLSTAENTLLHGREGPGQRHGRYAAVPCRRTGERVDAAAAYDRFGQFGDVRLFLDDRKPAAQSDP